MSGSGRLGVGIEPSPDGPALLLAAFAAAVVAAGLSLGWRGVDLPAQLYRVDLFHRHGFALWDSQWFGGHWLLDYSVLFPAVAAAVGVGVVTVSSAGLAALAFDRLVVGHFGRQARVASVAFALGVTVQSSIGQLTFLLGEAAGLWCLVSLARRRWALSGLLGAVAALTSPLAGAFVGLAVVTFAIDARLAHRPSSGRDRGLAGVAGAAATAGHVTVAGAGHLARSRGPVVVLVALGLPVAVTSLLFPGQGPMPYPGIDYLWELAVAAGLWLVTPRDDRVVRTGLVLYALALSASAAVPTPLGGNAGRLEDCFALPLAVALLWPRRGGRRAVLAVAAVPLALSQWVPAWAAMTSNGGQPWAHRAYYEAVTAWLHAHEVPAARVEVVPTADHWEAAYVAPSVALARGWERQLDIADNPLFYRPGGLGAPSYRAWLVDNGVRYVALADAPLDEAAVAEGHLVRGGGSGLRLVWRNSGWRIYAVDGSSGIVGPGAHLVRMDGSRLAVSFDTPGTVVVRVRYSPAWRVLSGGATIGQAPGHWLDLAAPGGGTVTLGLRILG